MKAWCSAPAPICGTLPGSSTHLCHRPEAGSGGTEVGRPAGRELSEQANRDFQNVLGSV